MFLNFFQMQGIWVSRLKMPLFTIIFCSYAVPFDRLRERMSAMP
ncbi:Uncharacterized protein dnm_076690 [Desulfonema magnum]|uniref:Uncharacterized protein n=1 Tax=Desulfonema magnum TaxID=45655 RepID=A0A975BUR2_9BACT|nr:Uncharacterized protein dnm_076690 [Desulfonema magnum]